MIMRRKREGKRYSLIHDNINPRFIVEENEAIHAHGLIALMSDLLYVLV